MLVQVFDTELKQFVSQEFVAGDECSYENQQGESVDEDLLEVEGKEVYLPFDMVQPNAIRPDSTIALIVNVNNLRGHEEFGSLAETLFNLSTVENNGYVKVQEVAQSLIMPVSSLLPLLNSAWNAGYIETV